MMILSRNKPITEEEGIAYYFPAPIGMLKASGIETKTDPVARTTRAQTIKEVLCPRQNTLSENLTVLWMECKEFRQPDDVNR